MAYILSPNPFNLGPEVDEAQCKIFPQLLLKNLFKRESCRHHSLHQNICVHTTVSDSLYYNLLSFQAKVTSTFPMFDKHSFVLSDLK